MDAKDSKVPNPQQSITAVRQILHDGELYQPGDLLEVTPDTAQILITSGAAQESAHA